MTVYANNYVMMIFKVRICMSKKDRVYINQPISKLDNDAINMTSYVDELESAIESGAKSIAVTSTFGSGKSSLIRLLEKRYSRLSTKFCYINMWSHLNDDCDNIALHKTFLYQFANQISNKKGQYISKRLNENYGLFNLRANSTTKQFFTYIFLLFVFVGFAFTKFFDDYTSILFSTDFFKANNTIIGIAAFSLAAVIAAILLFDTDIVFSSKTSETSRKIDENEIMDIYNSYICRRHLRKYIVVIEGLDRTNNYTMVMQFLKELRKYYMPKKSKITFIVNIKPEGILLSEAKNSLNLNNNVEFKKDFDEGYNENSLSINEIGKINYSNLEIQEVFPKIFDYILDLKTINYDNYDTILVNLLEEKEKNFTELGISIWKNKEKRELIPEFEWIIMSKHKDIGIREIKERLNYALSMYKSLKIKFKDMPISLKKCLVSSYLASAYSYEYHILIKLGVDKILDIYASNNNISSDDFILQIESLSMEIANNSDFCNDLLMIINSKLLEDDYRNYFYNLPEDSEFYNSDELRLINIIIYHERIGFKGENLKTFENLVDKVNKSKPQLIEDTLNRLDKLTVEYPLCIIFSKTLLKLTLLHNENKVWSILDSLDYRDDFNKTKSYLLHMLSYKETFNNSNYKSKIFKSVLNASEKDIISFRQEIRGKDFITFDDYKIMYFDDFPLLTIPEIKSSVEVLDLINYNSGEYTYDKFKGINDAFSKMEIYSNKDYEQNFVDFYLKSENELMAAEGKSVYLEAMTYMRDNTIISEALFYEIINDYNNEEILELFIELVNNYSINCELPEFIIDIIEEINVDNALNVKCCEELYKRKKYSLYVKNMLASNNHLNIDYNERAIKNAINNLPQDYLNENYKKIREGVLNICNGHYNDYMIFDSNFPLVEKKDLKLIENTCEAIKIIPISLINEENYKYICDYFNRKGHSRTDSYSILYFVTSIKDSDLKKLFFESLDFKYIHYNMISFDKKQIVISRVSDVYDFNKTLDIIQYMSVTRTSNDSFEKKISPHLSDEIIIEKYRDYVEKLIKVNNLVIQNLVEVNTYYSFSSRIQLEFYKRGYYKYYIVSKTLRDGFFTFEKDKLEILETVYFEIFTAKTGLSKTINCMQKSSIVDYFINRNSYTTIEDTDVFIRFASGKQQSSEILNYIINTFDDDFCIEYFSCLLGFDDRKAAETYVSIMENNPLLAKSEKVFDNTHDKLVGGDLKFRYTIAKRRAKKAG